MCRLLKPLVERVECEQGNAFTYLGDDWLLLVDRCSKASQFLSRTKVRSKHVQKTLREGLQIVSDADALSTSFPGSPSSASFGHWKKDPGCGWSREHLRHTLFHGVESTNIFVHLKWRERKAIAGHRYIKQHPGEYTFEILKSYSTLTISRAHWLIFIVHKRTDTLI